MPDFASRLRLLQATSDKPGGYAGPAGVDGADGGGGRAGARPYREAAFSLAVRRRGLNVAGRPAFGF
jgi:hypothetical protein